MIRRFAACLLGLALSQASLTAQIPGQGGAINAALSRLYADAPPFSADCTMTVTPTNRAGMRPVSVPMKFLGRDGRLRLDLDLSRMQGADIPADQLRSLRQLAMVKMNTVIHADAQRMLVTYPDLKASTVIELPPGAMPDPATLRLEATTDGEERLGGEPTTRERVTLTAPDGTALTGTLWRSPRQGGLPVKLSLNDADSVVTIELKGVRLQPPPGPEEFGTPAGFREYSSLQELTQEAMRRTERR